MVDPLTLIELYAAWSFVFKPILEEVAKDMAKDFAKDFCGGALKNLLSGKDEWTKAALKALKEFLEEFEGELISAGESEESVKAYSDSLRKFTKLPVVRETLGKAVIEPTKSVESDPLAKAWSDLGLERLPDEFDWLRLCRRYQNKARAILRSSPDLRVILDSQTLQATAQAVQQLAGVAPGFDFTAYADGLKKRYETLRLETLDAGSPVPIHLVKVFVEQNARGCQEFNPRIHELPIEHRRRFKESGEAGNLLEGDELERCRQEYFAQSTRPALEVVRDPAQRLLVILGDPGSGKSVLLQYLALQWALLPPVGRAAQPLPLLLELKAYVQDFRQGKCSSFLDYLDHGPSAIGHLDQHRLHELLTQGRAWLSIDGLDEVFDPALRQTVVNQIIDFTTHYSLTRVVVTSRVIGYQHEALRNAGFGHHMLESLEPEQVTVFLQRWHALAFADDRERREKLTRLERSIQDSAPVRELVQNPLLLTLTVLLNRHQELPRARAELYEQASRLLLQQWDASPALLTTRTSRPCSGPWPAACRPAREDWRETPFLPGTWKIPWWHGLRRRHFRSPVPSSATSSNSCGSAISFCASLVASSMPSSTGRFWSSSAPGTISGDSRKSKRCRCRN